MRNIIPSACILFMAAISLTACVNGKGDIVVQTFEVSGFTKIDHGVKGNIILVNDVNQFVEVHAQQNIIDVLKIEVADNTLKIRTKSAKSIGKYDELTYYVHTPSVDEINIGGKGTATGADITGNNFKCKLSADGELSLTGLDVQKAEVIISGAGQVTLTGKANVSDLGVGSAGRIKCFELISKECRAELKGNGIIETYVQNKFDVFLSGSGTIYYKGNPGAVNKTITGSGLLVHSN